jgi:hypothetical protein
MIPLSMRFSGSTHLPTARVIAVLGVALYAMRLAGVTWSMMIGAFDQEAKLEAINHIPRGAAVVSLVGRGCKREWAVPRNSHLPGMIIARREGFSNDQWQIDGTNLLRVHYPKAGIFQEDPSQMVAANWCAPTRWKVDNALRAIPRDAFDYVWLVDAPPYNPELTHGMTPVWKGPGSMLYRIDR